MPQNENKKWSRNILLLWNRREKSVENTTEEQKSADPDSLGKVVMRSKEKEIEE